MYWTCRTAHVLSRWIFAFDLAHRCKSGNIRNVEENMLDGANVQDEVKETVIGTKFNFSWKRVRSNFHVGQTVNYFIVPSFLRPFIHVVSHEIDSFIVWLLQIRSQRRTQWVTQQGKIALKIATLCFVTCEIIIVNKMTLTQNKRYAFNFVRVGRRHFSNFNL